MRSCISCPRCKLVEEWRGEEGGEWCLNKTVSFKHQVIEEDKLQENSRKVGGLFLQELLKLRDEFEVVGDVRGKGLMLGMEFVKSKVQCACVCACMCVCVCGCVCVCMCGIYIHGVAYRLCIVENSSCNQLDEL